jgi:uncharacterized membrane protein
MLQDIYNFFSSIGYSGPLHPASTHMPIGLVVGALVFGLVALVFRRAPLWRCSWNCLLVAGIFAIITIALGLMDWQHFLGGIWLFPVKVKAAVSAALFCLLLVGLLAGYRKVTPPLSFVAVLVLSFIAVVTLGYFGGKLHHVKPAAAASRFEAGEKLFVSRCQNCHPGGGNVLEPAEPITGSKKLNNFKLFLGWIRDPEPPMPAFPPAKISDEQARQLYDYIVNVLVKQPPPV